MSNDERYIEYEDARGPDGGLNTSGGSGGRAGESAPLQCRARFLKNWPWISVADNNRGLCERGKANFGTSRETHDATQAEWEKFRHSEITLENTLDFLQFCHRSAPFLNFNGNTFSAIGRIIVQRGFVEFSPQRAKLIGSAVGHYVAGTLDKNALTSFFNEMVAEPAFEIGTRVTTLKKSLRGVVKSITKEGDVVWQPDRSNTTLTTTPSGLLPEQQLETSHSERETTEVLLGRSKVKGADKGRRVDSDYPPP